MIENLLQLVKEFGETNVVQNPEVPNEQNNAVLSEAGLAVAGTLQQALAGGNVQDVVGLFQQDDDAMASPLSQQIQGNFIDNVTSKLGINRNTAMAIGASLLPLVINTLVKRTRSDAPEDSGFNLNSLIGSLTGGNSGGGGFDIGGLISQFTGGGQQGGNGGFDFGDLINQVKGGAGQQQDNGGLANLIQGFFGK